jgi:hypothetical protein
MLGGGLVGKGSSQLWRDGGEDSLERPPVIVEIDDAVLDGIPELPGLHLDLHQQRSLMVVRLGEHQPRHPHSRILVDSMHDR